MNPILDSLEQPVVPPKYLKRSTVLCIVQVCWMVLLVLFSVLTFQPWRESTAGYVMNMLVGITFFLAILSAPFGVYWIIRSFRRKEGVLGARILLLLWHLVFALLLLVSLAILANDLAEIL